MFEVWLCAGGNELGLRLEHFIRAGREQMLERRVLRRDAQLRSICTCFRRSARRSHRMGCVSRSFPDASDESFWRRDVAQFAYTELCGPRRRTRVTRKELRAACVRYVRRPRARQPFHWPQAQLLRTLCGDRHYTNRI